MREYVLLDPHSDAAESRSESKREEGWKDHAKHHSKEEETSLTPARGVRGQ